MLNYVMRIHHCQVNMPVNTVEILNFLIYIFSCIFQKFFLLISHTFRPPFSVLDAKRFKII